MIVNMRQRGPKNKLPTSVIHQKAEEMALRSFSRFSMNMPEDAAKEVEKELKASYVPPVEPKDLDATGKAAFKKQCEEHKAAHEAIVKKTVASIQILPSEKKVKDAPKVGDK